VWLTAVRICLLQLANIKHSSVDSADVKVIRTLCQAVLFRATGVVCAQLSLVKLIALSRNWRRVEPISHVKYSRLTKATGYTQLHKPKPWTRSVVRETLIALRPNVIDASS